MLSPIEDEMNAFIDDIAEGKREKSLILNGDRRIVQIPTVFTDRRVHFHGMQCEKCPHYRTRRIKRNWGKQEYCNLNKNDLPHSLNRVSGTPRWCPLYAKVKYLKEVKNG
jgi:hypothetical protein